jgi:Vilmaviridae nuclease
MTHPTPSTEPVALDATKSSHRWTEMPGNWDRLNLRALFTSDTNEWGIPDLPPTRWVPARLVAYNDRPAITRAQDDPRAAVHFFLDDYRFETLWSKPERGLSRCRTVGAALTPDFSLWTTMPLAMQLWQVYRSRWCGAWLLHQGVHVVPTVSWSTPDSYRFAFAGIPAGSVVAVSTVGIVRADSDTRARFVDGYAAMLHHLQPTTVLVYGRTLPDPAIADTPAGTEVRYYPTRWATREAQRAQARTEQDHGGGGQ